MNSKIIRWSLYSIIMVSIVLACALFIPRNWIIDKKENVGLPEQLSEQTQLESVRYSKRWPQLASLSIVSFDFNNNNRASVFRITPDEYTAKAIAGKKEKGFPIFSDDGLQNKTMQDIIAGGFECEPSKISPWVIYNDLADYFVLSCRTPIDPTVGRVVGYLVLHFKAPMTEVEIKTLSKDTKILAIQIYFNEMKQRIP